MYSVFVSTFRLMLHVKRASLDLGLNERDVLVLHVQTMDSIGRLSNPPQSIVYTPSFILWLDFR